MYRSLLSPINFWFILHLWLMSHFLVCLSTFGSCSTGSIKCESQARWLLEEGRMFEKQNAI